MPGKHIREPMAGARLRLPPCHYDQRGAPVAKGVLRIRYSEFALENSAQLRQPG
jgi:hypothetical protein